MLGVVTYGEDLLGLLGGQRPPSKWAIWEVELVLEVGWLEFKGSFRQIGHKKIKVCQRGNWSRAWEEICPDVLSLEGHPAST